VQFLAIPGVPPAARVQTVKDLCHLMCSDNPEKLEEIDAQLAEIKDIPMPVEAQPQTVTATTGTPQDVKQPAISAPAAAALPGDIRIDAKKKQISPQDILAQHGVDVDFKKELMESMRDKGYDQSKPILSVDTALGHILLDGHHRGHAAKALGIKKIPSWTISHEEFRSLLDAKFGGMRPGSLSDLDPYIYVDGRPYTEIRDDNDHQNASKVQTVAGATISAKSGT